MKNIAIKYNAARRRLHSLFYGAELGEKQVDALCVIINMKHTSERPCGGEAKQADSAHCVVSLRPSPLLSLHARQEA